MEEKNYITYEYKSVKCKKVDNASIVDTYLSLGYQVTNVDDSKTSFDTISFKRDRQIKHKTELNRLEKKITDLMNQNKKLEKEKSKKPSIIAYVLGSISALIMGTGMSLTMIEHNPTLFIVGVVIGIIGIILMVLNYFFYNKNYKKNVEEANLLIEENLEKIATVCVQADKLNKGLIL